MNGKLSLVATPIGNMEDITLRAIRTLSEADAIFAEDTRRTANLLARHQIRKPLHSCPAFSEARRGAEIAGRVAAGERIALVTDAGTPGISDPGFRVVRACLEGKLAVEVIPGACAAIAALSVSGLPTDEFHFVGFLPTKPGACERRLRQLVGLPGVLVLYESPHRLLRTLTQMAAILENRPVVVAREITKQFEEFLRGTSSEILAHFQSRPPRGEFVVLIGPNPV
ncbi:MAG: 16S rRNA (cytidine(1402)-2'-O)-methyltransferase [Verrucomicrobia bacterium]|nr:16S rRNA (cytidine(1402)-2'-O)-methyltransferase [Verrucomicrobiota bacterium]